MPAPLSPDSDKNEKEKQAVRCCIAFKQASECPLKSAGTTASTFPSVGDCWNTCFFLLVPIKDAKSLDKRGSNDKASRLDFRVVAGRRAPDPNPQCGSAGVNVDKGPCRWSCGSVWATQSCRLSGRFPLPIKQICQNGVNESPNHLLPDIPAPIIEVYVKHTDAHNRAQSCVYPAALGTFLTHVVAVSRPPFELTTY